jgi:osmoprotectant transport system ATP-binding protein
VLSIVHAKFCAGSIRLMPGEDRVRPASTASSVEFRHATKRYRGQPDAALGDFSLKVEAGEICVLVGPSGCGKTTALRLVNRMIELSGGDILIDDVSIRTRPAAELRRGIGYVIQQIGLFPHLTIGDNVGVVPRLLGWDRARTARRVEEMLDLVSLPADMRDRFPAQLSGGQRQRVGVARALAADPPLMLMDEPFGAVDPINRERLQNQFLRLQSEIRKTILFVTHDIDEAIKMGDRVAVMQRGGVLAQYAGPAELLMSPANGFVEDFVGSDRALKRLSLLRVRDVDLWRAPLARVGEPTAAVRARIGEGDVPHPLVVDEEGRPVGWMSDRDLAAETVPARPDSTPEPLIELETVLRDALSDLLQSDTMYAPVVDGRGHAIGVLSVAVVSDFLSSSEATEQTKDPATRASI